MLRWTCIHYETQFKLWPDGPLDLNTDLNTNLPTLKYTPIHIINFFMSLQRPVVADVENLPTARP